MGFKLIFFLTLFYAGQSQAQLFVGNGGEGWRLDGKLIVRDLAENGLHRKPFFGDKAGQDISNRVNGLALGGIPFSRQLLARKISDLNALYPRLGDFVVMALSSYAWSYSDFPLRLLPDDRPVAKIDETRRVQIANRFQTRIQIHLASWNELDEVNRVALLIHEGVYSLVSPQCEGRLCTQPAHKAREIVAQVFTSPDLRIRNIEEVVGQTLDLPYMSACPVKADSVTMTFWNQARDQKMTEVTIEGLAKAGRDESIESFCDANGESMAGVVRPNLSVRIYRGSSWTMRRFYQTGPTPGENQLWIQSFVLIPHGIVHFKPSNVDHCKILIKAFVDDWLEVGLTELDIRMAYRAKTCTEPLWIPATNYVRRH